MSGDNGLRRGGGLPHFLFLLFVHCALSKYALCVINSKVAFMSGEVEGGSWVFYEMMKSVKAPKTRVIQTRSPYAV